MYKLLLFLIIGIILFVVASTYISRSLNNLINTSSRNKQYEEVSQLPVDFTESNTIAIVCPKAAQNNPLYPDADCKNTLYYGIAGIQQAVNNGGTDHTVYVKEGVYKIVSGSPISLVGSVPPRSLTLMGDSYPKKTIIDLSNGGGENAFNISGNSGFMFRNLYFTGGVEKGYIAIKANTNSSISLYNTNFQSLYAAITIDNINSLKIVNNKFINDHYSVYEDYVTASNSNVSIRNSLFYKNSGTIGIGHPETTVDLVNNVFLDNTMAFLSASNNFYISNNIFYNTVNLSPVDVITSPNSNSVIRYNFFYNNTGGQTCVLGSVPCVFDNTNVIGTDPKFISTNFSNLNLNLQQSSTLLHLGDPSEKNPDETASSPGMYGGTYACLQSYGCLENEYVPHTLDFNSDKRKDISDVILLIEGIFNSKSATYMDLNYSTTVDIQDIIVLINEIFK
ncbi:hypothetical protein COV24_00090 [candidate division WWE3 bacterium CG10_big_fil_rev_8_21_14_0_10_32_10]|uniref:Right handed beta helix domain-containing protein n=1 Tax=candidate division WWE3 bacterium CG10_big_fil_rev_8_21_14_0_10_32_10 TaxID=1975090 RepID=A0A2H0RBT6_UNCKA|nr:MAG: hypothetical protein COV24_00090 [candidate division WWE3 bacterium CG10_big_fil_rev_8_21_14_0_10_32_10]